MEQPPGQGDESSASSRQHAFDLMEKKKTIQAALDAQFAILTANNATMNTPLVDAQGFPRAGTCP
jgi:26S proteasome regulatory subunit N4